MENENTPEPTFTAGLDLSESFYHQAIKPIIDSEFSGLQHSAALIGAGSEVLGFDNEMSSDHCWGPRVLLFLSENDFLEKRDALLDALANKLPEKFSGYSTKITPPPRGKNEAPTSSDNYSISIYSIKGFFADYLGVDITEPIKQIDWLTFPEQKLATITAGRVFHDDLDLEKIRASFAYYPKDVWLYMLACGWARIEQEEHLMGRAGDVGDELGSAIIGARLVRDLMRLCFLMEKRYAPYPKWFGSAFAQLKSADSLAPILSLLLSSREWRERQRWLAQAFESVAKLHNALRITEPINTRPKQFFTRPFLVISMGTFSNAICGKIEDPEIRNLISKPLIGSIDQFSDNTDLLANSAWRQNLLKLYD